MARWRLVPGFCRFKVSDEGVVFNRSLGRPSSVSYNEKGYAQVNLRNKDGHCCMFVHTAVLLAFVGPRPVGYEARHLDGNPKNNRLGNLLWGTHSENQLDSIRHGTSAVFDLDNRGERHGMAKLTEEDVVDIRRLRSLGWSYERIAPIFGIVPQTAGKIARGQAWKHLR